MIGVADFFSQVFLNPGAHTTAIMIMSGVTVAACLGIVFLVKQVYERYCPDRQNS